MFFRKPAPAPSSASGPPVIGVIGGTGFTEFPLPIPHKTVSVATKAGKVHLEHAVYRGTDLYFLLRHGRPHAAPHEVNYRANALALSQLRVTAILASAAVGALHHQFHVGDFALVSDFIDVTRGRPHTVLAALPKPGNSAAYSIHTPMLNPYCPTLRTLLAEAADAKKVPLKTEAVYIATEGPRFETQAEIRAYRMLGGDVAGMTGVPEVVFARELGICYAALALVTNMATGLSHRSPTAQDVEAVMAQKLLPFRVVFHETIDRLIENRSALAVHGH